MKDNKISFRSNDVEKLPLILDMVYKTLDRCEANPNFDKFTIDTIRHSISILDGWETINLNNAFKRGVFVGSDPNIPTGVCNNEVYSYVNDFFNQADEK